jgi:hypothetical protein
MMFTFNPEFNWKRNPTARRAPQLARLCDLYEQYDIHYKRVVYMGKKKSTKKYCTESIDLLELFFEEWGTMDGCTVFRDGGGSMASGLTQFGFTDDVILPAAIHQYLSVNDNDIHGYAKHQWRMTKDINYADDPNSCLRLMNYLDNVPEAHIRHRFDVNFALQEDSPTVEHVLRAMGKRKAKLTNWHDACLRDYRVYAKMDARGEEPDPENPLWGSLDGRYWTCSV